ncbi:hypothetical protein SAGO17_00108 [Mimivirus AB-566-O17]|uniref:Uncharacterized protein n=1 Tax=Mimivirus AB-566-O17 TaxID=1988039 RepID=A0A1X9VNY7_9VIRU|nr:hypothetical protein SAGO17_00108 [Mimivirus AB-566-O17]
MMSSRSVEYLNESSTSHITRFLNFILPVFFLRLFHSERTSKFGIKSFMGLWVS